MLSAQYLVIIMTIDKGKFREEMKELIDLVRLDEKYASLAADPVLPVDYQALELNSLRRDRIKELSLKYGIYL